MVQKDIRRSTYYSRIILSIPPLVPGSILIVIGFEMVGIWLVFWDNIKAWIQKHGPRQSK